MYLKIYLYELLVIFSLILFSSFLFTEIPSICPVKNPNYHISMQFGPNIHPLHGNWYIHKGIDFSTWRSGDPVLATASGQVVTVAFDNSFGNL